jgi:hypothetical protein
MLYDAIAHGTKHWPHIKLARKPRMADFARWVAACEGALWEEGTFMAAYDANRADAARAMVETSIVARAVLDFMDKRLNETWEGATNLLNALTVEVGEQAAKGPEWPKNARSLSGKLRRIAPSLRKVGPATAAAGPLLFFRPSQRAQVLRPVRPVQPPQREKASKTWRQTPKVGRKMENLDAKWTQTRERQIARL